MPERFPEIKWLVPLVPDFDGIFAARTFAPFSDDMTAFLQSLSEFILKDRESRKYPDVVSFAFWCRRGALQSMKEFYCGQQLRLGRGIVFHVTPSNVPVNFAYSLAAGLLAGNINIVRVPSRSFPQIGLICSAVLEILEREEFRHLRNHIVLLNYEKNEAITSFFSANCDVRIIWGGDRTIADIRNAPIPARSFDLTFADRYSFCVINADAYLSEADPTRIAENFYNDTYLFDQNACTAPHLVVWLGDKRNVEKAQELFWNSLYAVVSGKYIFQTISAVDKITDAYRFAASYGQCNVIKMKDNLIVRIKLDQLKQGLENVRSMCGYFYEYEADTLNEILPLINRKFQTLSYFGISTEALRSFVAENRPSGIDRIVPIGRTLDFSLTWDGYDLIAMLSRTVSLIA